MTKLNVKQICVWFRSVANVANYQIRFQDACKDYLRNITFEGKTSELSSEIEQNHCVNDQNEYEEPQMNALQSFVELCSH